jgi:hypothetical protein
VIIRTYSVTSGFSNLKVFVPYIGGGRYSTHYFLLHSIKYEIVTQHTPNCPTRELHSLQVMCDLHLNFHSLLSLLKVYKVVHYYTQAFILLPLLLVDDFTFIFYNPVVEGCNTTEGEVNTELFPCRS